MLAMCCNLFGLCQGSDRLLLFRVNSRFLGQYFFVCHFTTCLFSMYSVVFFVSGKNVNCKVLKKIFGPSRDRANGKFRINHIGHDMLRDLYTEYC
jgi:hypothetical protein